MNPESDLTGALAGTSKRIFSRVLAVVENRLDLLVLEAQEERERVLLAILLVAGIMVFALLAGIALTAAVLVLFWQYSPFIPLLVLIALYVGVAVWLYLRLQRLRAQWETLPATIDQLRKDRQCLEKILS